MLPDRHFLPGSILRRTGHLLMFILDGGGKVMTRTIPGGVVSRITSRVSHTQEP